MYNHVALIVADLPVSSSDFHHPGTPLKVKGANLRQERKGKRMKKSEYWKKALEKVKMKKS